jgi:class 3 adenylate cyclase
MPEIPSGTVTFLITDIEGSTALWERDRERLRPALLRVKVKQPAELLGCLSMTTDAQC